MPEKYLNKYAVYILSDPLSLNSIKKKGSSVQMYQIQVYIIRSKRHDMVMWPTDDQV